MHCQSVPRGRSLDVERPSFGIASEDARHALLVGAESVNGCRVDRVTWADGEHRLDRSRKLAIESRRCEVVALGRSSTAGWNQCGREPVRGRMLLIVGVENDDGSRHRAGRNGAPQFLGAA